MKNSLTEQINDTNKIKSVVLITVIKCKGASLPRYVSVALLIPKRENKMKDNWIYTDLCHVQELFWYPDWRRPCGEYVWFRLFCETYMMMILMPPSFSVCIPLNHWTSRKTTCLKTLKWRQIQENRMLFHKQSLSNSVPNKKVNKLHNFWKKISLSASP